MAYTAFEVNIKKDDLLPSGNPVDSIVLGIIFCPVDPDNPKELIAIKTEYKLGGTFDFNRIGIDNYHELQDHNIYITNVNEINHQFWDKKVDFVLFPNSVLRDFYGDNPFRNDSPEDFEVHFSGALVKYGQPDYYPQPFDGCGYPTLKGEINEKYRKFYSVAAGIPCPVAWDLELVTAVKNYMLLQKMKSKIDEKQKTIYKTAEHAFATALRTAIIDEIYYQSANNKCFNEKLLSAIPELYNKDIQLLDELRKSVNNYKGSPNYYNALKAHIKKIKKDIKELKMERKKIKGKIRDLKKKVKSQ